MASGWKRWEADRRALSPKFANAPHLSELSEMDADRVDVLVIGSGPAGAGLPHTPYGPHEPGAAQATERYRRPGDRARPGEPHWPLPCCGSARDRCLGRVATAFSFRPVQPATASVRSY